jgi:MscS family membrane protein
MNDLLTQFNAWRVSLANFGPMLRMALGLVLVLAGLFGARIIRKITAKLHSLFRSHAPEWLNILTDGFSESFVLLVRAVLWYLAVYAFPWQPDYVLSIYAIATKILRIAIIVLVTLGFWNSSALCRLLLHSAENKLDLESNKTLNHFFEKLYRAFVFLLAVIAVMTEFGFNVTGIVTGAGLVGLTLSLAAQSAVSSLVAGVAIVLEHPFGLGDWIVVGDAEGTVEDISFRSTQLRTVDNVLITIENSQVCSTAIQNVTGRTSRLLTFTIGLKYDTPRDRIEALCTAFRTMLGQFSEVCPKDIEVNLLNFAESSIEIELRCYVTAINITAYRALKNRMNLQIMGIMQNCGCEFAFPSTSVYLEHDPKNV